MMNRRILRGALLGVACSATLAAQSISFNTPIRDYPAGGTPSALALGDFNGDGVLDVVGSLGSGGLSVLPGTGKGAFKAPIVTLGAPNANAVAVGDFNNDGKLDVAMVVAANAFYMVLGNGDGTFQAPLQYSTGFTGSSVAAADLNHDGNLDLVILIPMSHTTASVAVLLGKGDGTFLAPTETSVGDVNSIVLADFNRDGNVDIALGGGGIAVMLGTGTGAFSPALASFEQIGEILSMNSGDVNGDGIPDLVVDIKQNGPSPALVVVGNGDGTFQTGKALGFVGAVTAVADMNKDGKLDLVGSNSIQGNTGVFVAFGNGDSTFNNPSTNTPSSLGAGPLVGLFVKSGAPDVITAAYGTDTISILLNKGNGTFVQPTPLATPSGARVTGLADLNHDGARDMVTVDGSGISVFLGLGNGTFQSPVTYPAGSAPSYLVLGDFNNDGKVDVAVTPGNGTSTFALLFGNGDGTFQPAKAVSAGGAILYGGPVAADFNQDGNLDLVIPSAAFSRLLVLLGNGNGTFQPAKVIALPFTPQFVSAADLNHDGKADLATGGAGSLSVLLVKGDGTFQVSQTVSSLSDFLYPAVSGDLNGDGKLDLVVPGTTDDVGVTGAFILLGNGDGTFQPTTNIPGYLPFAAVLADFNRDGKLDLAMADSAANNIPVLPGNGDGTFGVPTRFPGGFNALGLTAGDLNEDNKPDLVVASRLGAIILLDESK